MITWVTMLTMGAAAGFAGAYFKVYYPYTIRLNK